MSRPAGRLTDEQRAVVERIINDDNPRPHELDDDPPGTHDAPAPFSAPDAAEVERLAGIKD